MRRSFNSAPSGWPSSSTSCLKVSSAARTAGSSTRLQPIETDPRDLRSTQNHRNVEAGARHRLGDQRRPLQVADAQQVLDIEQDAATHAISPRPF